MKATSAIRKGLIAAVLVLSAVIALAAKPSSGDTAGQEKAAAFRVGIFDSRSIALAYAASEFNEHVMQELMKEKNAAEEKGDLDRVAELEKQGEKLQDKLHRQGFGKANVDDLLEPVKNRISEAAASAKVDVIADDTVYVGPRAVTVDVTDAIVALYDPSPKTAKTAGEIRKHAPLSWDQFPIED